MTTVARHIRLLLGARLRALLNRFAGVAPDRRLRLIAVLVVGAAIILGLGELAAPALLEAPVEAATGGSFRKADTLPAGTLALEAAFWLSALAASLTTFRAMELLYRRRDIRAIAPYPLNLTAVFVDRLAAAVGEAVAAAGAVALFFVPLIWHGGADIAGLAAGLAATGLVTSSLVGFAIQVYAGDLHVRGTESDKSSRGDIYGGGSQALMFSPGLAFAVAAALILLARLAFGELLTEGGSLRAFWVANGAMGVAVLAGLIGAYRRFVARFPAMSARFREVDLVGFQVEVDYQTSAYEKRGWVERLIPASVRPAYRANSLQFGRRYALTRYSYGLFWLIAGLAVSQWSRQAFPSWAVAAVPAVAMATLANPWARLTGRSLAPHFAEGLPLSGAQRTLADLAVAARESVILALPYALLVLWIDMDLAGATAWLEAGVALAGPLGLNGFVALAWRLTDRSRSGAIAAAVLGAVAIAAAAILTLYAAAAVAALGLLLAGLTFGSAARASSSSTSR